MELVLGIGAIVAIMIFGFGFGLISNTKYFPVAVSLWIVFIVSLIAVLLLYILEVIHDLIFPQLWVGLLALALLWLLFANFGSFIVKRLDKNVKTQQRDDKIPEKPNDKEEEA